MNRFLTVAASTKRSPAVVSGKRAAAQTKISSLSCSPLDPVDPELKQRLAINTPHELLQTFVNGDLDVLEGDILTVSTVDYPIRSCAEWDWHGVVFQRLILEDLKR